MSITESHLGRAALDALRRCALTSAENEGWVERAALDEELALDEWVIRNPHRLSRLDSTLATLAREGHLQLDNGRLRLRA